MKTPLALAPILLALASRAPAAPTSAPTNAPAAGAAVSDNYRMVPMDRVAFKNDVDPSPNNATQAYIVNSRGDLEIPVSRGFDDKVIVHANGRTISEVRKDLVARLEAQYYKTSNISLYLENTAVHPGTVTFYGEIKGNVQLPAGQPKYLSECILDMKPSEYANLKKVKLIRRDSVTGKPMKPIFVNVEEILSEGKKEKDYVLQDGDYVYVNQKLLSFK